MLPISIVEHPDWIEYNKDLDPSFNVPTRQTIKSTALPNMKTRVFNKMKTILNKLEWVNVSCDGWSDKTMRSFNGYIAQGIDDEWNLLTIPIAFQYVTGSHTGKAIKSQFDAIQKEFGLTNKTY